MIIYKIINLINGKKYIGQSKKELKKVIARYKTDYKSPNRAILFALALYGFENFKFEIIDTAKNLEELNKKEYEAIINFNTLLPYGYNMKDGGNNAFLTDESKQKISKANKGRRHTLESKQKISFFNKGRISPMAGKKHLNETKNKISKAHKGQKRSLEVRQKLSLANTGKILTESHKQKISNSLKGKKIHSLEFLKQLHKNNTGSKNKNSKLTEEKVGLILLSSESASVLAKKYNVTPTLIRQIRKRKIWKHVNTGGDY